MQTILLSLSRRQFSNFVLLLAMSCCGIPVVAQETAVEEVSDAVSDSEVNRTNEFYEIRIYKISDYEKQSIAEKYIANALLPALNRAGSQKVGVFTNQADVNDHSIYMVIPFKTAGDFGDLRIKLAADSTYQSASADYFDRALKDPVFERIESRFLRAFDGMKQMEFPEQSKEGADRIFELRIYESHTEHHAAKKVDMFNTGEVQLMRDVKLGPIFFGETLAGADVPNLVYMLSASDMESHKQHWKTFIDHPEWKKMSQLEKYKDTVSKISKWYLKPTSYSQF